MDLKDQQPTVSIIVPCRNEAAYIEACLHSILEQEPPPGGFELIVADGMSDDGTREIITRLAEEDSRLRIVDNPGRITPHGMNIGIREARGQYIALMGAHTEYATDYVRQCAALLDERPEICCSGGPIVSRGRGVFGRAVAVAMSHPVGVGNAKHRFPSYEGYAEGACFPMFRKEIFEKVGLYDENLVRNQDDDFNYRVTRSGGKIFISPRAQCRYYVRDSPLKLFRQYFQYGYWRVSVLKKHRLPSSLRQLIPVLFFGSLLVSVVIGFCTAGWWRVTAAMLPLTYASALILAGVTVAMKEGGAVGVMFPVAAMIMHIAYAAGFVWNIVSGRSNR